MVALLVAAPLIAPRHQQAQDNCTPVQAEGCYVQAKRDIAFLIDATGSVEQRGQTYNIQVEGVRRAISDPTVIPRDGSVAVAVIVFNEAAQVFVPLTEVTSEAVAQQIAKAVDSLKCTDIHSHHFPCPMGATLYAPAIQAADIHLSRARNDNPKPGVHRVFSLLHRVLDGTYQGAARRKHLTGYIQEFEFRFNRRTSGSRGLLFQRLLELAVGHRAPPYWKIIGRVSPSTPLAPAA